MNRKTGRGFLFQYDADDEAMMHPVKEHRYGGRHNRL
jgi:signal transduction histidine kinase